MPRMGCTSFLSRRTAAAAIHLMAAGAVCASCGAARSAGGGYALATFSHVEDHSIPADTLVITFQGIIDYPLAEDLQRVWRENAGAIRQVILALDSYGGKLNHVVEVIAELQEIKRAARLTTVVGAGKLCASGCVPVYMQGEERRASVASAWMFHGSCPEFTNLPDPQSTADYLRLMREAGLSAAFAAHLDMVGCLTQPGEYWLSGYQLHYMMKANVITTIIAGWQPEDPREPPFDRTVRPR